MRASILKIGVVLLMLVAIVSRGFADDEYVDARLGNILSSLQDSSLELSNVSGALYYSDLLKIDPDDPERSIAVQALSLFLAAINVDQIIGHLGIEEDFPHNYLTDYAQSFYDDVFLPMDRGDFSIEETGWWVRTNGGPPVELVFTGGYKGRLAQVQKFYRLIYRDRLYAGAFLRVLAKNIADVQGLTSADAWRFFAWVIGEWPDMVFESAGGKGFNSFGISPILLLSKGVLGEDIEFYKGRSGDEYDRTLLFPQEEDWDYGEETTGRLKTLQFNDRVPASMKDIHLGLFCLVVENFDSGKKYAMRFDFPPFAIADIEAVPGYHGGEMLIYNDLPPVFSGMLYFQIPPYESGGQYQHWGGYSYFDPARDLIGIVPPEQEEQDRMLPFYKPTFYESGVCPAPPNLADVTKSAEFRYQYNQNIEVLRGKISGVRTKGARGSPKKGLFKERKIVSPAHKLDRLRIRLIEPEVMNFRLKMRDDSDKK